MSDDQDNRNPPGDDSGSGDRLVLPGDDQFPLSGTPDGDDGEFNGLETDDRQSQEIREIFGTAFPQYLQPVQEILDQIFAGQGDRETTDALNGMIASLMEASSRMGFDKIHEILDNLNRRVGALGKDPGAPVDADLREGITYYLDELRAEAREMGGKLLDESDEPKRTIVEALKNKEGVGSLVLRRLSTAGLITVDQLLMARPEEIAAVSGIEIDLVHRVLKLVAEDIEPQPTGRTDLRGSGEIESIHDEILERLRAETEAEAAIGALKAEIRLLRSRISQHRAALQVRDLGRGEDQGRVSAEMRDIDQRAALIARLSTRRDHLAAAYAASEEAIQEKEVRLKVLTRESNSMKDRALRLSREVGGLVDALGQLRKTFARVKRAD